ncbi:MAG TPA: D-alanyl-D-alanine carboxypeptidase, partial [Flavihumibacter sp.]|nr:D-alanyl-D-alanine carboxypeptidase [Flavihumibacter sp.]
MTNNDLKFNQIRVWRSKSRLVKRKADTARWVITAGVLLCNLAAMAQQEGLQQRALKKFSQDPALKFAGWSLVVQEAGTGRVLVDRQGNLGLPAASTQKIFTSIAGYDLLGKTFRYETNVRTIGNSSKG